MIKLLMQGMCTVARSAGSFEPSIPLATGGLVRSLPISADAKGEHRATGDPSGAGHLLGLSLIHI